MKLRKGWTRLSPVNAPGQFRCRRNRAQVFHCGHPAAPYPYYVITRSGRRVLAANGRGFRVLGEAMDAAERL